MTQFFNVQVFDYLPDQSFNRPDISLFLLQTIEKMMDRNQSLTLEQKRNLPIFFIIARPRSGTTLLRTLFDRHSNVIIPLESPFMLRYYWKYRNVKNWTKENILAFYEDITSEDEPDYLNIRKWTIDLEQLKKDLLAMEGEATYAELCRVVNASYQSLFPKGEIKIVMIHDDVIGG